MEIVIRAVVIYLFLWLITRAVGRSTLGELSSFQLLLYVVMGDLVQQSVTQQDYSLTAGLLAIGTMALLTVAVSWVQWRSTRARPVTSGRPVLVWRDGTAVEQTMRDERLSMADLLASAREQGIKSTREIEYAVLEDNGKLSFFTQETEDGAPDTAPET